MRASLAFLLLVASVQAYIRPISITARNDEKKIVFNCVLDETDSVDDSYFSEYRKDDQCKSFRSDLDKINVELEVEIFGMKDFDAFNNFSAKHGNKIKILKWHFWDGKNLTASELLRVFKIIPDLKKLELKSFKNPMTTDENFEVFRNLRTLAVFEGCDSSLIDFLIKYVPRDNLQEFSIEIRGQDFSPAKFSQFMALQKNIKTLKINGNPKTFDFFKDLKLKTFAVEFWYDSDVETQKQFLHEMLRTQSQLTELNLMGADYSYKFMDDDFFADICKLQNLEIFLFNIDGISKRAVYGLSNLKKLKNLHVKSNLVESSVKFNHLSLVEMPGLEKLDLAAWTTLPRATYTQFSQNCVALKSLTVRSDFRHSLNFLMETFSNLEVLDVKFGSPNRALSFQDSYKIDDQKHRNLKTLTLAFSKTKKIDLEGFAKLLNAFPNLESFRINSDFVLTEDFGRILLKSLGKIKNLHLDSFYIDSDQDFSPEILQILKELDSKLDQVYMKLINVVEDPRSNYRTLFDPLTTALKDDFYLNRDGYSNTDIVQTLELRGGNKIENL